MSVEGLQAILQKEPVVGTHSAETMCQNPQVVEDAYLRHVRSEQLVTIHADKVAADLAEVIARFRAAGRTISYETLAVYTGIPQWCLLRWISMSERLVAQAAEVLDAV